MSAFIVGREHVRYLVNAALRVTNPGYNLSWRTADGPWKTLRPGDIAEASRVGQMLWDENVKSVAYRYPNDARDELPGPVGETFEYGEHALRMGPRPEPAQIVKAARCLAYQSCEHPEWEASEACAFLDALKDAAVSAMLDDHERRTGKRLAWAIDDRIPEAV